MHNEHHHEHYHAHEHHHEHHHEHEHTAMDELIALMKYMTGHNAAHAKELADLAVQLEQIGKQEAYFKVMNAVSDFEKGNQQLEYALKELTEK